MSQVSKRVIAAGFQNHPKAAKLVQDALSPSAELDFAEILVNQDSARGAAALVIGPAFDFDSDVACQIALNCIEDGTNLVIIGLPCQADSPFWQEFIGAKPLFSKPAGEWFFNIGSSCSLSARLPEEFAASGQLTVLEPRGDSQVLLSTSIAFRNYATATISHHLGSTICVLGLAPTSDHVSEDLASLIRRAAMIGQEPAKGLHIGSLGVGIVGYGPFGGMGTYHATAVAETEGMHLVAVVDSDAERRSAALHDFPDARAYATAEEMAQDDEVDIAVIATPPISHASLSLALLDAGKHVISEKPMCLSLREARLLIDKARAKNRMFSVNQNRRWDSDFRSIIYAVEGGSIGSLFNIETFVGGFEHPCRAWHSEESISGGAVFDWGSHHVDQITQLYGSAPAKVSASQHKRVWHDVTNVDQIRVHMLWEDGREAEFFQSDIAAIRKPKYFIQGTKGTIIGNYRPIVEETVSLPFGYEEREHHYAEAPAALRLSRYESGIGLVEESMPLARKQRFAFHKNVADHLLLGEPLAVRPESVAGVIATLEAAQLSATTDSQYVKLSEVEC